MNMNQICQSIDANGVATIEINRPDKRNAFDKSVVLELTQAFTEVSQSTSARIVVLRGAGPVFCSGGDIHWMRQVADSDFEQRHAAAEHGFAVRFPLVGVHGRIGDDADVTVVCRVRFPRKLERDKDLIVDVAIVFLVADQGVLRTVDVGAVNLVRDGHGNLPELGALGHRFVVDAEFAFPVNQKGRVRSMCRVGRSSGWPDDGIVFVFSPRSVERLRCCHTNRLQTALHCLLPQKHQHVSIANFGDLWVVIGPLVT